MSIAVTAGWLNGRWRHRWRCRVVSAVCRAGTAAAAAGMAARPWAVRRAGSIGPERAVAGPRGRPAAVPAPVAAARDAPLVASLCLEPAAQPAPVAVARDVPRVR